MNGPNANANATIPVSSNSLGDTTPTKLGIVSQDVNRSGRPNNREDQDSIGPFVARSKYGDGSPRDWSTRFPGELHAQETATQHPADRRGLAARRPHELLRLSPPDDPAHGPFRAGSHPVREHV